MTYSIVRYSDGRFAVVAVMASGSVHRREGLQTLAEAEACIETLRVLMEACGAPLVLWEGDKSSTDQTRTGWQPMAPAPPERIVRTSVPLAAGGGHLPAVLVDASGWPDEVAIREALVAIEPKLAIGDLRMKAKRGAPEPGTVPRV